VTVSAKTDHIVFATEIKIVQ